MHCWEAAKISQAAIIELLLFRKSTGVIPRDALPASQRHSANGSFEDCQVRMFEEARIAKCECLWSRANCQVRMFLKQPNRRLQQLLAVENKTILQQPKPSTFCIMFHLTLFCYPHHTGMRSQMLFTNGSFEICQERMFVKPRGTHGWSTYLLSEKIFILKQKSSNLYMICFNSVKKFLSNYLCTLHWHAFTNALHQRVIWNQPRANVCEAASNTRLKHLLAVEKNIYAQAKIIKSLHDRF